MNKNNVSNDGNKNNVSNDGNKNNVSNDSSKNNIVSNDIKNKNISNDIKNNNENDIKNDNENDINNDNEKGKKRKISKEEVKNFEKLRKLKIARVHFKSGIKKIIFSGLQIFFKNQRIYFCLQPLFNKNYKN